MWRAAESVARRRVWGESAWMRVGGSTSEEAKGMRTFDWTWPVVEEAALRRPSVPAE
jgi:hypothetical protein